MGMRNSREHNPQDDGLKHNADDRLHNDEPRGSPACLRPCITISYRHLRDGGEGEGLDVCGGPVQAAGVIADNEPPDEGPHQEDEDVDAGDDAHEKSCVELHNCDKEICSGVWREGKKEAARTSDELSAATYWTKKSLVLWALRRTRGLLTLGDQVKRDVVALVPNTRVASVAAGAKAVSVRTVGALQLGFRHAGKPLRRA